jgi:hypothetical protein
VLNQPGTQRLKLEYDKLLSSLALNFKLGRCTKAHCMHPHDIPGDYNGRAVQVNPMQPKLKPPGTERLKLKCDILPPTFAFKFNLRRYTTAPAPRCSP